MNNIFDQLKKDHYVQKNMLKSLIENYNSIESVADYIALKNELTEHAKYEERIFYKPLISFDESQDKARHGIAEHQQIDKCIENIDKKIASQEDWRYYLKKLQDLVEHHIEEEEESLFQIAQNLFTDTKKEKLADNFYEQRS